MAHSAKPVSTSYNTLVAFRELIRTEIRSLVVEAEGLVVREFDEFKLRTLLARLRLTEEEIHGYDDQIRNLVEDNLLIQNEENGGTIGHFTEDELHSEIESRFKYERLLRNGISSVNARLEMEMNRIVPNTAPDASTSWPEWEVERIRLQRESVEVSREAAIAAERRGGRRPYVDPDVFDGKMTSFKGWWEIYKERVHENDFHCPTKTEKFAILKRVIGSAKSEIDGLGLSDRNYDTAIALIKKRYDNDEAIKNEHIRLLIEMKKYDGGGPNITDSLRLRDYLLEIERILCELENLGVQVDNESVYVTIVTSKLPPWIIEKLHRRRTSNIWKMQEVRSGLRNILDTIDESRRFSSEAAAILPRNKQQAAASSVLGEREQPLSTASALIAPQRQQRPDGRPLAASQPGIYIAPGRRIRYSGDRGYMNICLYCDSPYHTSGDCKNIVNLTRRRDLVYRKGRCFVCLSSGHQAKNCTSTAGCKSFFCRQQRAHHPSLCPNKFPKQRRRLYTRLPGVASSQAVNKPSSDSVLVSTETPVLVSVSTTNLPTRASPSFVARRGLFADRAWSILLVIWIVGMLLGFDSSVLVGALLLVGLQLPCGCLNFSCEVEGVDLDRKDSNAVTPLYPALCKHSSFVAGMVDNFYAGTSQSTSRTVWNPESDGSRGCVSGKPPI